MSPARVQRLVHATAVALGPAGRSQVVCVQLGSKVRKVDCIVKQVK